MSSLPRPGLTRPAFAADVRLSDTRLTVEMTDGREISVPLTELPFLLDATPAQRAKWEIVDSGIAVSWPDLDEEVGLAGMLGISESFLEEAAGYKVHRLEPPRRSRILAEPR